MSDFIELKNIKSNKQKEQIKNIISKSTVPFKKSYHGLQGYIAKKGQEQQAKKNMMNSIRSKVSKGEIKSLKDVEKLYGYGTFEYGYASQSIRQKQLRQIREQAMFNARKKVVTAKAKEAVFGKPRVVPKGAGFNPMSAFIYGAPRKQAVKKKVVVQKTKPKPKQQVRYIQKPIQPSQSEIQKKKFNDLMWNS